MLLPNDEKTAIAARSRRHPGRPPGVPVRKELGYRRHGTTAIRYTLPRAGEGANVIHQCGSVNVEDLWQRAAALPPARGVRLTSQLHATSVDVERGARLDQHDAVVEIRTTLLLTAAYSAASGGDRSTALGLLDEAEEDTERLPEVQGLFTVGATRAQADV
ncbi:hypothetical protein ABZ128_12000 [Streptomyces sp. NPDC006326]|uniref:hypothetical protein n=1 Tax=Streptomyces sp. NPDC006326 TaxID=3156752 RepID=UPI0033AAFC43